MVKVYKNVCITGAGNGIGRAVAIAMSNEGYNVVCADIDLKQAKDTLDFILNKQGSGIAVETDVTKAFDIKNMINSTVDEFGSLDILVNNAGVTRTSNIMDLTEKDWYWINDVNAKGTFFSLQAAAKQMIKQNQGGRIINNGSVSSVTPRPGSIPYTATKHAVTGMTKTISLDGRKYDIACSQIDIGNAETPMTQRMKEGVPQANGNMDIEPVIDSLHIAEAVLYMANLPVTVNVLNMTVMANKMPFVGRG